MAGRGRGGGGVGRGRGKGNMSFNMEQLGFAPGEVLPGPVLQPPALYPPMEFRPAPLENGEHYEQQRVFKTEFVDYFNKSNYFMSLNHQLKADVDQFSNEVVVEVEKPLHLDWSHFPPELKPNIKRKRKIVKNKSTTSKIPKKNIGNLNTWLEELEKKEVTEDGTEAETEDGEKKKDDEEHEDEEEVEEDDMDEEMDDGTDYNQNYFDNGEGYLDDDDDNLDDGPIY